MVARASAAADEVDQLDRVARPRRGLPQPRPAHDLPVPLHHDGARVEPQVARADRAAWPGRAPGAPLRSRVTVSSTHAPSPHGASRASAAAAGSGARTTAPRSPPRRRRPPRAPRPLARRRCRRWRSPAGRTARRREPGRGPGRAGRGGWTSGTRCPTSRKSAPSRAAALGLRCGVHRAPDPAVGKGGARLGRRAGQRAPSWTPCAPRAAGDVGPPVHEDRRLRRARQRQQPLRHARERRAAGASGRAHAAPPPGPPRRSRPRGRRSRRPRARPRR